MTAVKANFHFCAEVKSNSPAFGFPGGSDILFLAFALPAGRARANQASAADPEPAVRRRSRSLSSTGGACGAAAWNFAGQARPFCLTGSRARPVVSPVGACLAELNGIEGALVASAGAFRREALTARWLRQVRAGCAGTAADTGWRSVFAGSRPDGQTPAGQGFE